MSNPRQTNLDDMIARIEEANARAYKQFDRALDSAVKSEPDSTPDPPRQPNPSIAPKRQLSRVRPSFVALVGLVLVAFACVGFFLWKPSYGTAAKQIVARWTNVWVLQTGPQAQTAAPAASEIAPDIAQRLQRMADNIADTQQQVEQLKVSQQQIVRENAKVADQFAATLAEMTRQNAALAKQLKENQGLLAETSANLARLRRR
jgi:hypothetical protein